jgi:hypothetical protein
MSENEKEINLEDFPRGNGFWKRDFYFMTQKFLDAWWQWKKKNVSEESEHKDSA